MFFKNILIVKVYRELNKNIFNNFLIAAPHRTLLFQKLPSLAPTLAPESGNALCYIEYQRLVATQ